MGFPLQDLLCCKAEKNNNLPWQTACRMSAHVGTTFLQGYILHDM